MIRPPKKFTCTILRPDPQEFREGIVEMEDKDREGAAIDWIIDRIEDGCAGEIHEFGVGLIHRCTYVAGREPDALVWSKTRPIGGQIEFPKGEED